MKQRKYANRKQSYVITYLPYSPYSPTPVAFVETGRLVLKNPVFPRRRVGGTWVWSTRYVFSRL